ncbi:MAG TPA: 3-phosphoshikimate 1-carboxyvinyltransferase, partial [Rhodospirillales bacterium]|nr:3-phosphoshikimate 1-carboxyvinyltransferase [Rhodospirillales bacterium]
DGGRVINLHGQPELSARNVAVPGDISSAAFPLVSALLTAGSEITINNVGINPLRCGLIETLLEMGGRIELENQRTKAGEAIADLRLTASPLIGIDVPAERAPAMIDEYPVLAIAAACATGSTRLSGLAELRLKESDRLAGMVRGLAACGVDVEEGEDFLVIHGTGAPPAGGATIATELDHRMAMAFLVLGGVSENPVAIDDGGPIDTSFPGFAGLMNGLGCNIKETSS